MCPQSDSFHCQSSPPIAPPALCPMGWSLSAAVVGEAEVAAARALPPLVPELEPELGERPVAYYPRPAKAANHLVSRLLCGAVWEKARAWADPAFVQLAPVPPPAGY